MLRVRLTADELREARLATGQTQMQFYGDRGYSRIIGGKYESGTKIPPLLAESVAREAALRRMSVSGVSFAGWIAAPQADAHVFSAMGVDLGPYDEQAGCFMDCRFTPQALDAIAFYWGIYLWHVWPCPLRSEAVGERDAPIDHARFERG